MWTITWAGHGGAIRGEESPPQEIRLRFSPEAGKRVAEEFWHKSQQVEMLPDGSVLFRLYLAVTPEFVNWVLYYGSQVQVELPESLRQQVAEEHRRAAEVNR